MTTHESEYTLVCHDHKHAAQNLANRAFAKFFNPLFVLPNLQNHFGQKPPREQQTRRTLTNTEMLNMYTHMYELCDVW